MYGKLFVQMYDGTLATRGPWQALVTFQQLIALANRHGEVDMTKEVIARRTTIPIEIINIGIAALEQPDPDSRSPVEDGRRIVRLTEHRDWGWRIVNYTHYAKLRTDDERREYFRQHKAASRAKKKANVHTSPQSPQAVHDVTHAYADTSTSKPPIPPFPAPDRVSPQTWADWLKHKGKKMTKAAYVRQVAFLAKQPDPTACIERSLLNGWAGLFPSDHHDSPGPRGNGQAHIKVPPLSDQKGIDRLAAALGIKPTPTETYFDLRGRILAKLGRDHA